ncbi:MAG TPA: TIGR02679 family protein, partial [Micromonosporaceae bacterium]|nr:TIGR02679 family protein [Micromonosporaceae bacterium]
VRVGPLDEAQREAVADLLGMDRLPDADFAVSLAVLDEVLQEAVTRSVREVVTELLGPLDDRAARRSQAAAEREALWRWLSDHEVVTAQPALREWVSQVRRVGGPVSELRPVLRSALSVLGRLPAEGTPLPAFADAVLHDPHALDDGTRLSGLVFRALAALYGVDPPASAEERRALWERAGVAADELSTVVLAAGWYPSGSDSVAMRILRACGDAGMAAALTLAQLNASPDLSPGPADVWVVENPSLLALALRRFGAGCPPMVCTAGWPNSAGVLLLRRLGQAGARLHYHGDLDGEGVRIAAYVIARTGARPWRLSTPDYLTALRRNPSGPPVGRITEAPWDDTLAPAMREHRTAVTEEKVADTLLDDLTPHLPRR